MSVAALSREELRLYCQQLQALAQRLSGGVAQLTAEATRPTGAEGTETDEPGHEPQATSSEGDEEVARGVLLSEEQLLAEVRAALARFDAGTFGRCEGCGHAIGKRRLHVVPYARYCVRCAEPGNRG
ncbi:MAG: TraR/DksA family transcriptional regulator [Gemmata sp.]|jgi:RNA polymerase-binding transcription factor DksA